MQDKKTPQANQYNKLVKIFAKYVIGVSESQQKCNKNDHET